MPDKRHPLDERLARAHHAVEPPQMVVPQLVEGNEPVLVDQRRPADQRVLGRGSDETLDRSIEAEPRQRNVLAAARTEAGAPEQALGLAPTELSAIHR